jgi:hypothetical protein
MFCDKKKSKKSTPRNPFAAENFRAKKRKIKGASKPDKKTRRQSR